MHIPQGFKYTGAKNPTPPSQCFLPVPPLTIEDTPGSPSNGVSSRYVALQAHTKSFIGIPASMRASVPAFMLAQRFPEGNTVKVAQKIAAEALCLIPRPV